MPTSKISWTDEAINFLTWNCNKVSPGCKHCYAQAHSLKYPQNSAGGEFLGAPQLRAKSFDELRLTKPGKVIFVNTHSDTFHESIPLDWLKRMFTHMNQRQDLIFLLLTKRPQVALERAPYVLWTDNIWLGTSVESQEYFDRIRVLEGVPAKHKFISFEPLLGPIVTDDRKDSNGGKIEWVIVGGESGEWNRPFGKQWAVDIQQWCARVQIPFYYKQGSSIFPDQDRLLNGREYNERPPQFEALHREYEVNVSQQSLF